MTTEKTTSILHSKVHDRLSTWPWIPQLYMTTYILMLVGPGVGTLLHGDEHNHMQGDAWVLV